VLKNALLDKIVWYTNDYGQVKAKRWQDVERKDLEAFILCSICFGNPKEEGQTTL
jgi:hypothetical protein